MPLSIILRDIVGTPGRGWKAQRLDFEHTRRSTHGRPHQVTNMSPPATAAPGASSSRVSGKRKHHSAYHLFMQAVRVDMNRKFGGPDELMAHFTKHNQEKVV